MRALVACPTRLEAAVVRTALRRRGPAPRSVPSGRAPGAWTWVTPEVTLGVCVSGRGEEAGRLAAGFWALRAAAIVVLGVGAGTGLVDPPALVVDGRAAGEPRPGGAGSNPAGPPLDVRRAIDVLLHGLLHGEGGPPPVAGRVAAVQDPFLGSEARASLAAAGIAGIDAESDAWRRAADLLGIPALVLSVILDDDLPERLAALRVPGSTVWPPLRTARHLVRHPADRRLLRAHDRAATVALRPAADRLVGALVS